MHELRVIVRDVGVRLMAATDYQQVVYDLRRHAHVCRCRVDLTTLDGGAPAICVYKDDESGEITCSDACAIEVVTERRRLEDEADGRDVVADAIARRSA